MFRDRRLGSRGKVIITVVLLHRSAQMGRRLANSSMSNRITVDRINSSFPDSGRTAMLIMLTLDRDQHDRVLSHLTLIGRKTDMHLHGAIDAGLVVNRAATLPFTMNAHRHHPVALTGTIGCLLYTSPSPRD